MARVLRGEAPSPGPAASAGPASPAGASPPGAPAAPASANAQKATDFMHVMKEGMTILDGVGGGTPASGGDFAEIGRQYLQLQLARAAKESNLLDVVTQSLAEGLRRQVRGVVSGAPGLA